jgi:hypothetical protein
MCPRPDALIALLLLVAGAVPIAAATDAEIEACLTSGRIIDTGEELIGLTRPLKVEVECGESTRGAVFKHVDEHEPGMKRMASGGWEFNYSDSYLYERAAYLLDRQLGLGMVPVVVLRWYRGDPGALVAWISDVTFESRISSPFSGARLAALLRQKSRMRLFDSLIYNTDRRNENALVDEATGKLWLIDHTRAFRETPELQDEFAERRVWLTRRLYDNLLALGEESLSELADGLISDPQLEALLARRDLIIAKIDRDRTEHGDDAVFGSPDP